MKKSTSELDQSWAE